MYITEDFTLDLLWPCTCNRFKSLIIIQKVTNLRIGTTFHSSLLLLNPMQKRAEVELKADNDLMIEGNPLQL